MIESFIQAIGSLLKAMREIIKKNRQSPNQINRLANFIIGKLKTQENKK